MGISRNIFHDVAGPSLNRGWVNPNGKQNGRAQNNGPYRNYNIVGRIGKQNFGKNHDHHRNNNGDKFVHRDQGQLWQGKKSQNLTQTGKEPAHNGRNKTIFIELPGDEELQLIDSVKIFWQSGKGIQEVVDELVCNDFSCPPGLLNAPDRRRATTNTVVAILQQLKLISYQGVPRPTQWPRVLQALVAREALKELAPEDIHENIQDDADFEKAFNGWPYHSIPCAIGHFIGTNRHRLEAIAKGAVVVATNHAGTKKLADMTILNAHTSKNTQRVLGTLASEKWAQQMQNKDRGPNYVQKEWTSTLEAPRFGESSRFVVRGAAPHNPGVPKSAPEPVRPVANVKFLPRRCQGTFGCSRYCNWALDFPRPDGWSQHLFNNAKGIVIYFDKDNDVKWYEDADGDTIMRDNFPPWFNEGKDAEWRGSTVKWTACLASDGVGSRCMADSFDGDDQVMSGV